MKNAVAAGLIAGIIGAITINVATVIQAILGITTAVPGILSIDMMLSHLAYEIGQLGVFGSIFGILYSRFFDRIPSKGAKKGLIFGSIMYLFSNIYTASLNLLYGLFSGIGQYIQISGLFVTTGFFCLIPYGLALGVLFKKLV